MWSGGSDRSEAVLLYEPVGAAGGGGGGSPTDSVVGGTPAYYPGDEDAVRLALRLPPNDGGANDGGNHDGNNPPCGVCGEPSVLIAQVYAPLEDRHLDRTLYVFGCNRGRCYSESFRRLRLTAAGGRGGGGGREGGDGEGQETDPNEARARNFLVTSAATVGEVGSPSPVMCVRSQRPRNGAAEAGVGSAANGDSGVWGTSEDGDETGGVDRDDGGGLGAEVDGAVDDGGWGAAPEAKTDDGGWGDAEAEADDGGWGSTDANGGGSSSAPAHVDLEAMLARCELNADRKLHKKSKKARGRDKGGQKVEVVGAAPPIADVDNDGTRTRPAALPRLLIDYYEEPPGVGSPSDGDEDDDDDEGVGASHEGDDDDKVRGMLSRYLAEEEDDDIVAALRGGGGVRSDSRGGGGGGGEKYERLPPEQRAFLSFSERMRRAPRQVVRYAYGGVPLWSVPTPAPPSKKKQRNKKIENGQWRFPPVPPCHCCGSERAFEMQLVPPLLVALDVDVDEHAPPAPALSAGLLSAAAASKPGDDVAGETSALAAGDDGADGGGMNWGSLAVYCCPESCDGYRGEVVVMQRDPADLDGAARRREDQREHADSKEEE